MGLVHIPKKSNPSRRCEWLIPRNYFPDRRFSARHLAIRLTHHFTWQTLLDQSSGLIWLAGLISIIPLLMFSFATGKMPLALTGLIQFTLPIALLTIGVLFNEQKISTLSLTLIFMTAGMLIAVLAYDMKIAATSNLAQFSIDSEGVHPAQQHNPCAAKRPQSRADGRIIRSDSHDVPQSNLNKPCRVSGVEAPCDFVLDQQAFLLQHLHHRVVGLF